MYLLPKSCLGRSSAPKEYEQSQQVHDDLKLRYNRMTGPVNIYRKARELGFIAGLVDQLLEIH